MKPHRPSATAAVIAAAVVLASREPDLRGLVPPGAADWSERFLRHDPLGRRLAWSVGSALGRRFWRGIERFAAPGIIRHYLGRKRWIEERWREARADGFGRLLMLGAGYDSLSPRLAAEPDPPAIVEIDHPATQRVRREVFAPRSAAPSILIVSADLARELPLDTLGSAGSLHGESVFVVAEGLFIYLEPVRVREIMMGLFRVPARRVRVCLTFMEHPLGQRPAFRPQSRLVDWWLGRRGEPFRWGLPMGGIDPWLRELGWTPLNRSDRPGREHDARGLIGESAVVAERTVVSL